MPPRIAPVRTERPDLASGYGVPSDPDGTLDWSWAVERLEAARNYWVASTRRDGAPHVVPVWGAWVDGAVWFGTDPDSVKARNLATDPRVVVHLESGDETVILRGEVEEVAVGALGADLAGRIDDAYAAKYRDGETGEPFRLTAGAPPDTVVLRVRPRVALGWLETDFARSPTRWRFEQG